MSRRAPADPDAHPERFVPGLPDRLAYGLASLAHKAYLALLTWLNDVDKHRFAHLSGALARTAAITVSYGLQGEYAANSRGIPASSKT